ncbi:calmodulin-binding protein [Streptacidiphilus sp. PB12-B1b]|uniref:BP74-related protein n=1 Tax=Streptacidiphilus sp. PB12-B1b TaxID=2705012 RepID=UPI0015FA0E6F|nr:calmodulin-binding protein [Streptacidiphilus sp. PB12-B1b]QMU77020.1 calmodulin-binding protein [Streptacidiphilus sp. PB12-B1b]
MRRMFTRICSLAAVAMLPVSLAQPAQAERPVAPVARAAAVAPAYFEMTDITRHVFVVKLTQEDDIRHARELVRGETSDEPHLIGRIIKRRAEYNGRWDFQLDPETVSFYNYAIEVCDATIPYVNDHLDEAGGPFLPGLYWCPWTSRLIKEVPAP